MGARRLSNWPQGASEVVRRESRAALLCHLGIAALHSLWFRVAFDSAQVFVFIYLSFQTGSPSCVGKVKNAARTSKIVEA